MSVNSKLKTSAEQYFSQRSDILFTAAGGILKNLGTGLKEMGIMERDYNELYLSYQAYEKSPEDMIQELLNSLDEYPEQIQFTKAFIELLLLPDLQNFFNLETNRKIEVGEKLEEIAEIIREWRPKID